MALTGSPQQETFWDVCAHQECHVVLKALAGAGKTTSIVEACKRLPRGKRVAFVCFSKIIAETLKSKVPFGTYSGTLHSLGGQAVAKHVKRPLRDLLDENKVPKMLPPQAAPVVRSAVMKLTSLAKNTLCDVSDAGLTALAARYGVELEESKGTIFKLVRMCLDRSKKDLSSIDFDDMLYLPVVLGLPVQKFDVMFVDESQDLNLCQMMLIFMSTKRVIVVGDEHQAIFGFRGADVRSMATMQGLMADTGPVQVLPLSVTFRCAKAITRLAQKYVPEITAHENNPEGLVQFNSTVEWGRGDMVLCRTNAPLVKEAYRLISQNIPVKIQGRKIGEDLAKLIARLCSPQDTVIVLGERVSEWRAKEVARLTADQTKAISNESKLQLVADKCDCIDALSEGMSTVQEVLDRIKLIFAEINAGADTSRFVLLSSVHRAKGLESRRVFIINPEIMPHPSAASEEELEQEMNLIYVAITRGMEELHIRGAAFAA
jgi:DNA helicase-2/ATP-dependent DNA helicase PcrA